MEANVDDGAVKFASDTLITHVRSAWHNTVFVQQAALGHAVVTIEE